MNSKRIGIGLLAILIAASGYFLVSYYVLPKLVTVYPYTNATGLTSEEYLQAYSIPECVENYVNNTQLNITKRFYSGFESNADFEGFYQTPQKTAGTCHTLAHELVHSGEYAHKAWTYQMNWVIPGKNTNHRGYPTIQLYKTPIGSYYGRIVVDFWVWLDVELQPKANKEWFSFATFTAYADDNWYRSYLVNLDSNYEVHLMHVPGQGQAEHDIYQATGVKLPMKEWVRLTILIDLTIENSYSKSNCAVWQNGVLVSAATFSDRIDPNSVDPSQWPPCLDGWDRSDVAEAEEQCGLVYTGGLAQAHFGLYCPPLISKALVFNDDLVITEFSIDAEP